MYANSQTTLFTDHNTPPEKHTTGFSRQEILAVPTDALPVSDKMRIDIDTKIQ